MSKEVLKPVIKYENSNLTYDVIISKNKSRYWKLSVGNFNPVNNTFNIKFSSRSKVANREILKIVDEHFEWLKKQMAKKSEFILDENLFLLFGKEIPKVEFDNKAKEALEYVVNRYYELAKIAHVDGVCLTLRKMKARWGSYNKTKKQITLNKWLVILPKHLIDYVIFHELAHHYVFNHSNEFYQELAKYYPDYKVAKVEIKKYSGII